MTTTRVTIKDVAARAGVSKGAVSLAFNHKRGLSDATRERIFEAARELEWAPNLTARSLAGARVDVVGLALCRPARLLGLESFSMEFVSGVESVLTERSCGLLLRLVRDPEEEAGLLEAWWKARQIGGAILVDLWADDPRVAMVQRLGMPVVAVEDPASTGGLTSVWVDEAAAVSEAVRYLGALGHRRIARVGGAAELGRTAVRSAAFEAAVRALGVSGVRQVATDRSGEAGARATRSLLAEAERPTAIVYDNDIMAVAGLAVAVEAGLGVPADVSLLAWDDSPLCRVTHPTLSAMGHDVHGFGADVARTLFGVIGREGPGSHPVPAPVLTPRGSTAAPGG